MQYIPGVSIHWTGLLDWNTELDYWTELFSFFGQVCVNLEASLKITAVQPHRVIRMILITEFLTVVFTAMHLLAIHTYIHTYLL